MALLSKQNTCLTVHLWQEDETQIANLGFYVKVDPSNIMKEYFEECIRTKISECTRRDKKKIPQFHCGFSSPFVIEEGGCKQNSFLAKSHIVPIKGVTMEAMFYVSNEISQIPGVLDTFPHKDLTNQGRRSIMTDTTHFKAVTAEPC